MVIKKVIFIISLILLAGLSLASAYTPEQQITLEGTRISFQLGATYQQAQQGQNIAGYNALVDQWNTWVRTNFGEDVTLLMPSTAPNLLQPYVIGNSGSVPAMNTFQTVTFPRIVIPPPGDGGSEFPDESIWPSDFPREYGSVETPGNPPVGQPFSAPPVESQTQFPRVY